MNELIEKTLLAGIGALALSQKKAEELVTALQRQFNLSEEKGQELLNNLQETVANQQQRLEEIAREELTNSAVRLGLVEQKEFKLLVERVEILEKQLKLEQQLKQNQ